MSPETRSALMARIKGKNTGPERIIARVLTRLGLHWISHVRTLPGTPDFVFKKSKVVVFVDGDFWHGWRFPVWRDKLSVKWEEKIARNRSRDAVAHRKLRRAGWRVIRIWENQIDRDLEKCAGRILSAVSPSKSRSRGKT